MQARTPDPDRIYKIMQYLIPPDLLSKINGVRIVLAMANDDVTLPSPFIYRLHIDVSKQQQIKTTILNVFDQKQIPYAFDSTSVNGTCYLSIAKDQYIQFLSMLKSSIVAIDTIQNPCRIGLNDPLEVYRFTFTNNENAKHFCTLLGLTPTIRQEGQGVHLDVNPSDFRKFVKNADQVTEKQVGIKSHQTMY